METYLSYDNKANIDLRTLPKEYVVDGTAHEIKIDICEAQMQVTSFKILNLWFKFLDVCGCTIRTVMILSNEF